MRKLLLAGLTLAIVAQPALAQQSTTNSTQGAAQANVQAAVPPASTTVRTQGSTTVVTQNNPGNLTSPPASAQNKTYPRCSRTVQDNCTNPGGR